MSVSGIYLQEAREHAQKAEQYMLEDGKKLLSAQVEADLAKAYATMALVVVTADPND